MKTLEAPDRSTFEKLTSLLINMSNLQCVKYDVCLNTVQANKNTVVHFNGREWDLIRTRYDHRLDFDCTLCAQKISQQVNNTFQEIIASFSPFSSWFVNVFETESDRSCIRVYTKTRRLFYTEIDHAILRTLNRDEIATLIDGASHTYMYGFRPRCDNGKNASEYPSLVLPNRIFSKLDSIEIDVDSYMRINERLKSFLKQLFARTLNLKSIDINSLGSGDDFYDISSVLSCIEEPSISIKNCTFSVHTDYDEFRIKEVIFHLPMLTSLRIHLTYSLKDIVGIVNTCLIHSKHLLYLELRAPFYKSKIEENAKL